MELKYNTILVKNSDGKNLNRLSGRSLPPPVVGLWVNFLNQSQLQNEVR